MWPKVSKRADEICATAGFDAQKCVWPKLLFRGLFIFRLDYFLILVYTETIGNLPDTLSDLPNSNMPRLSSKWKRHC